MASKAELWTQLSYAIKIVDETLKFGNANTPNFISLVDTLTQNLEGNHAAATTQALQSFRSGLSSLASTTGVLTPLILELAKIGYNSRSQGIINALLDIRDGMIGASETVKNRAWTYGSVTAGGSNVGNGNCYRLEEEANAEKIEVGSVSGGVVKVEITNDKNTGATQGNEAISIYGLGNTPTDSLEPGTAPTGLLNTNAKRPQDGLISNSSFSTYSGTGATLAFASWTLSDATKAAANTSIFYRADPSAAADVSLELTDNNSILQYLDDASGRLDKTKPVFFIVRYRRKDSCDGALTIRLGTKTEAIADLTSKTNATWFDLAIANSSDCFYENFKENPSPYSGLRLEIALTGRSTGSLIIDDIILLQPQLFDGKWYLVTAGSLDYLDGDYFTFTDSVANTGRIQTTLARLFGVTLPHTSGSPTYADA